MKISFAFYAFALAFLATACNFSNAGKDPEPAASCIPDSTVSSQIMGKRWVLTAETTLTVSGSDTTSENTFLKIANCSLDDFMEFKVNNVITQDNGANKCVFFMPQSIDGHWCTTNNGQAITMTISGLSGEATITGITAQQMFWEEIKPNQPKGKTTIIRSTFEAR